MPYKPIVISKAEDAYKAGTGRAGKEWLDNFLATAGIAAASSSDSAQANYEVAMRNDAILKSRQKKLQRLSDEDFKAPARKGGAGLYTAGTAAKSGKYAKGFAPFAEEINRIVPTLPARTIGAAANISSRLVPLAEALERKKLEGA